MKQGGQPGIEKQQFPVGEQLGFAAPSEHQPVDAINACYRYGGHEGRSEKAMGDTAMVGHPGH